MKATIIYDNEVWKEGLRANWGFSCLVEADNKKILFDTGANGALLLDNMEKLDIDPAEIDDVFISHAHHDHTGGLQDFLKLNSNVRVFVPTSFKARGAENVISVSDAITIYENIFSTGELKGMEQSMAVKIEKGIVVIAGCSHPGVKNILKAASQFGEPYAIIGGLHGFNEFDLIKDLAFICPTHCTQFKSEIKNLYPEKYIEGGAGKIIEI